MADYKKFLIRQEQFNGSNYVAKGGVVDTQATYHVVCQECPFKLLPETKDVAKRDWHDEDGEDVYIPDDGVRFKAYDLEAKFLYVGEEENMAAELKGFVEFLYCKNTEGANMLSIYDEYTKQGRRGCYVSDVGNELLAYSDTDKEVVAQFKVKFRVTDPVFNQTLEVQ